jgi:hypothetical protein
MITWKYIGACADGQRFIIGGMNVWEHQWMRRQGESASVIDPKCGQPFTFPVYDIAAGGQRATFAAGEFSNCVWGFYTPEPS